MPEDDPKTTALTAPSPATGGHSPTSLLTAILVVVVLIVVVVLVVVKAIAPSSPSAGPQVSPASGPVVQAVTHIPASVYNEIGVTAPGTDVRPPKLVHGLQPLTFTTRSGAGRPGILSVTAEYCPYCAAQRWAEVAALSRFGRFKDLQTSQTAMQAAFGQTQGFSFYRATYTSPYVALQAVETADSSGLPIQALTGAQQRIMRQLDRGRYGASGLPSTLNGRVLPFMDIANRAVVVGGSFTPAVLQGQSRDQTAAALDDPTQASTKAIVATANYLSAAICAATGEQPRRVCASPGVQAADHAMGLQS